MSRFTEYECPVCKREFEEEDDIVVCPECGTPHHRECYNFIGHCVNKGLHESGYDFYDEHRPIIDIAKEEKKAEESPFVYYSPNSNNDYNSNNENESQQPTPQPYFPMFNVNATNPFEADNDTIDGQKIIDVAATVKSNVPRFIRKFKQIEHTKKKASWNWGAFIFGGYYYLYRKMFKQGILYLLLTTALSFLLTFLIGRFAPNTYSAMIDYANSVATMANPLDASVLEKVTSANDYQTASMVSAIVSGVMIFVRLMFTLFADSTYKHTVTETIKNVDKKLEEGATFIQAPMLGQTDNSLGEKQIRLMYLSKKGGTTLFIPLAAYLIVDLITTYL